MASLHYFSWAVDGKWRRIEHVRPNVPLVSSQSGEAIWCALYHVDAIEQYSKFEVTGFKHAKWPFLHFDIDGHSGQLRSVRLRRHELIGVNGAAPKALREPCPESD